MDRPLGATTSVGNSQPVETRVERFPHAVHRKRRRTALVAVYTVWKNARLGLFCVLGRVGVDRAVEVVARDLLGDVLHGRLDLAVGFDGRILGRGC
jgi:hypothetical protein